MSVFCCDLFLFYVRYFCFLSFTISFPCLSISRFSASRYLVSLPLAISLFCLSQSRFPAFRYLAFLPLAISLFCLSLSRFPAFRYLDTSICRYIGFSVSRLFILAHSLSHSFILSLFHFPGYVPFSLFVYIFRFLCVIFPSLSNVGAKIRIIFHIRKSMCIFFDFSSFS